MRVAGKTVHSSRLAVDQRPGRQTRSLLALTVFSTILAVLPVFLVGALALFVRSDLRFSQSRLAFAVSTFYAVSAIASPFGGRLAQRVGARVGMASAAALSGLALLSLSTIASSWGWLMVALGLAGIANSLAQPSANLAVAEGVSLRRQGVAFGIKQSAVPAASALAGLSVPALGVTIGWRWAAFIASLFAFVVVVLVLLWRPRTGVRREHRIDQRSVPRRRTVDTPLIMLALGGGVAVAAASTLGPFYVESGVAHGLSVEFAGLLLALGGVSSIVARIFYGWLADRFGGGQTHLVVALMTIGAAGFLVYSLAHDSSTVFLVTGTAMMFAAGWGWNGLLIFAVVRRYPGASATATGIVLTGTRTGGIVGPIGFGVFLETSSYAAAWGVAAMAMLLAAVLLFVVGFMRDRSAHPVLPLRRGDLS